MLAFNYSVKRTCVRDCYFRGFFVSSSSFYAEFVSSDNKTDKRLNK